MQSIDESQVCKMCRHMKLDASEIFFHCPRKNAALTTPFPDSFPLNRASTGKIYEIDFNFSFGPRLEALRKDCDFAGKLEQVGQRLAPPPAQRSF